MATAPGVRPRTIPIIEIAADDPEILAGRPFRGANQRLDLPGWRAAMLARYDATDYGNITLLAADAVGGLEVRTRDGRWLHAPVIEDACIRNIGDCLMRWTNDAYVSTPHRVVSPEGIERRSLALFLDPNPDALVACLPTCETPNRPARYAPILAADYLRDRPDAVPAHRRQG